MGLEGETWCIVGPDSVSTDLLGFVSLLEEPILEVRQTLREALVRHGRPLEILERFPSAEILQLVIARFGDHWIERALDWMEATEMPPAVAPLLAAMIDDKRGTQAQRHRARRLLHTSRF